LLAWAINSQVAPLARLPEKKDCVGTAGNPLSKI
jgi:hypothetical protein